MHINDIKFPLELANLYNICVDFSLIKSEPEQPEISIFASHKCLSFTRFYVYVR